MGRGAKWRSSKGLDDKVRDGSFGRRQGGPDRGWDLVEEFFRRIQDPLDDNEDDDELEAEEEDRGGLEVVVVSLLLFPWLSLVLSSHIPLCFRASL